MGILMIDNLAGFRDHGYARGHDRDHACASDRRAA